MENVLDKLREELIPVFGLEDISEIEADHSLVNDLGADSIDFVEIMYISEKEFNVVLKTQELVSGSEVDAVSFEDDKLTEKGVETLKTQFKYNLERFSTGMTKVDIFQAITVRDLADSIESRM